MFRDRRSGERVDATCRANQQPLPVETQQILPGDPTSLDITRTDQRLTTCHIENACRSRLRHVALHRYFLIFTEITQQETHCEQKTGVPPAVSLDDRQPAVTVQHPSVRFSPPDPPGSVLYKASWRNIKRSAMRAADRASARCAKGRAMAVNVPTAGARARVLSVMVRATENPSARSDPRPHCAQVNRLPLRRPPIIVTV